LGDAEQQKVGLKKQIDIYLQEENTMHGENAKVVPHDVNLTAGPASST
jgi:hypothetical protein